MSAPPALVPLPNASRPRLLVPTQRRAALAALTTRTDGAGPSERLARTGFATLARLGLLRWGAPGDRWEPLREQLCARLDAEVVLAIRVGADRPNRKPVVQVLRADGATLAWAKVGHDPATRTAVRHEAAVLRELDGGDRTIAVPRVLDLCELGDDVVLVTTPIVTRGIAGADVPTPVAFTIARRHRWTLRRLEDTTPIRHARTALAASDAPEPRLRALLDRVRWWQGERVLTGGAHGDLGPTNLAVAPAGPTAVWDWERAGDGVPIGMDVVHHALQSSRRRRQPADARLHDALVRTRGFAHAAGVRPDHAPLILTIELVAMHARLADARRQGRHCDDGAFGALTDALLTRDPEEGSTLWT